MARKPRGIRFKLLIVFLALPVVFVVIEIAARLIMARGDHAAEPTFPKKVWSVRGFEEELARLPDDPNRARIVFLGDSYTSGVLTIQPDQTLVHHVGVLLEKWKPGRYISINLGITGCDSIGEWGLYNRLRDVAHADVVVQVISPRGLDADACRELFAIKEFQFRLLPISKISFLSCFIEQQIRGSIGRARFIDYFKGGKTQEERERAWRIFRQETIATKKLVEEGGATYAMVRFPLVGLKGAYPLDDVHRQSAALADELGLQYLDLLDAFRGQDLSKMGCWEGDSHPGVEAHQIAGKAIADFLMQSILPKIPSPTTRKITKPRTLQEIEAAEAQHYRAILDAYPNCVAAQHWWGKFRLENRPGGTP